MKQKRFLVKDQSGRGEVAKFTISQIRKRFDANYCNGVPGGIDPTLGFFLEFSELGDAFENQEDHITFTRIE